AGGFDGLGVVCRRHLCSGDGSRSFLYLLGRLVQGSRAAEPPFPCLHGAGRPIRTASLGASMPPMLRPCPRGKVKPAATFPLRAELGPSSGAVRQGRTAVPPGKVRMLR